MQNRANANGRYYPKSVWVKNVSKIQIEHYAPMHMPQTSLNAEWLYYEAESKHLSVSERQEFFATAWDWGIKAYTDRASIKDEQTRIAVSPTGIRGVRQHRRLYYNLEDFKRLFSYVTRYRQCETGLMRKGEVCAK